MFLRPATAALALLLLVLAAGLPACESLDDEEEIPALTDEERAQARELEGRTAGLFDEAARLLGERPGASDDPRVRDAVEGAQDLCREYLDRYPGEPSRDKVLFRLGTLCKSMGDLEDAHEAFSEILKRHPGSEKFRDTILAEWEVGCRLLEGEKVSLLGLKIAGGSSTGAEILEMLYEAAPGADFADEALYRLGNYRLENGEFDEAVVNYETLVRRFPDSPFRLKAEYQAARSFFLKFYSLDYDLTPLEEALGRFRAFIELHGEDPSEVAKTLCGQDGARKMTALIENLLAEKNYRVGRWYQRRGRPEASVPYFQVIVMDFPQSEWAKPARERLAEMGK